MTTPTKAAYAPETTFTTKDGTVCLVLSGPNHDALYRCEVTTKAGVKTVKELPEVALRSFEKGHTERLQHLAKQTADAHKIAPDIDALLEQIEDAPLIMEPRPVPSFKANGSRWLYKGTRDQSVPVPPLGSPFCKDGVTWTLTDCNKTDAHLSNGKITVTVPYQDIKAAYLDRLPPVQHLFKMDEVVTSKHGEALKINLLLHDGRYQVYIDGVECHLTEDEIMNYGKPVLPPKTATPLPQPVLLDKPPAQPRDFWSVVTEISGVGKHIDMDKLHAHNTEVQIYYGEGFLYHATSMTAVPGEGAEWMVLYATILEKAAVAELPVDKEKSA